MSSILEALRKAEREAAAGRGEESPWPPPVPVHAGRRIGLWRVVAFIGIGIGLGWAGMLVWSQWTVPEPPPGAINGQGPPSGPMVEPAASSDAPPTPVDPSGPDRQALESGTVSPQQGETAGPRGFHAPVAPVPAPAVPPLPAPEPEASGLPMAPPSPPLAVPRPAPLQAAPPLTPAGGSPAGDDGGGATETPYRKIAPAFKTDPRVELQALVWSPHPAERFVVINNRLLKEGGRMDTIQVVEINPDDVLLEEGPERWHEPFAIR